MSTASTKLPQDGRIMKIDPDLATAIELLLAPHSGKLLEKAQAAVLKVNRSLIQGSFGELVDAYAAAIAKATAKGE